MVCLESVRELIVALCVSPVAGVRHNVFTPSPNNVDEIIFIHELVSCSTIGALDTFLEGTFLTSGIFRNVF